MVDPFAERYDHPGSAALVALTSALTAHWATGQSALEDANLAALMGWLDPPAGMTGAEAGEAAEDPLAFPPAGPVTDPTFDNEVLAPLIDAYTDNPGEPALARLVAAVRGQIEPTWDLVWRGVELLRALPPGSGWRCAGARTATRTRRWFWVWPTGGRRSRSATAPSPPPGASTGWSATRLPTTCSGRSTTRWCSRSTG
ncbi:hypothetical protein ACFQX7_39520 [Luedemannella flava]